MRRNNKNIPFLILIRVKTEITLMELSMTSKFHKTHLNNMLIVSSIKVIYEWVFDRVRTLYPGWKYCITSAWLARYDKGHYTVSHDHIPTAFSFVYFIKSPQGSAPLFLLLAVKVLKQKKGSY